MRALAPVLLLAACARQPAPTLAVATPTAKPQRAETPPRLETADTDPEPDNLSPQPVGSKDTVFADECPALDAALNRVAEHLATSALDGAQMPEASRIELLLREEGGPYVWPHAWTLTFAQSSLENMRPRLRAWLQSFPDAGQRRCGFAWSRTADGRQALSALAVDALADLAPVPAHVRVGAWLTVEAEMRVPYQNGKFVVLGPRGAPKSVPTSASGSKLAARFAVDSEGPWVVQLLADVQNGPRPVLEALLMGGTQARRGSTDLPAPGEDAASAQEDGERGLGRMLDAARTTERLRPLAPRAELDEIAREQAIMMQSARRLAHNAGAGAPDERADAAGVRFTAVGENVAHAGSVAQAHRALWNSPSHRANILSPYFDSIGIGISRDSDGTVWVCEFFARLTQ